MYVYLHISALFLNYFFKVFLNILKKNSHINDHNLKDFILIKYNI